MVLLFIIDGAIILVVTTICLIVKLADLFMCYYTDDHCAKISFKSFKRFYEINPDRWELNGSYVKCLDRHPVYSTYISASERFDFNFIDYIRYDNWRKSNRNKQMHKKKMESTARMLALVKQDVEQFESKANAQTNQATDNIRDIINNM